MLATGIRIIVLALIWTSLQGSFGIPDLLFGLLLGGLVNVFAQPIFDQSEDKSTLEGTRVLYRFYRFFVLLLVYLRELAVSSLTVARITVAPSLNIRPAVVEYPLDVKTQREITALANLICLTPGTLSLDVSADRRYLYIHSMSVDTEDGQELIDDIKGSLERQVKLAFGPRANGSNVVNG